jgi:hypothetical protein
MAYEHTQNGYLWLVVFVWSVLLGAVVVGFAGDERFEALIAMLGASLIIIVVVVWFNRLTVRVSGGEVRVGFGPGWPRRVIPTAEIVGFRRVRNKWFYGWGIRKVSGGWMYNVWGLDAVELDLSNGKKFRIGTDEPSDLIRALHAHTSLRAG